MDGKDGLQGIGSNLKSTLKSSIFSDLTIICGGESFNVHKIILYSQSRYFATLLGGQYREAEQDTIELHDDDPAVMKALIHYFYNFTYDDAGIKSNEMLYAVKVYAMADKYQLVGLKKMAAQRFERHCNAPNLSTTDFGEAIEAVDACVPNVDRTLWNVIIPAARKNLSTLMHSPYFKQLCLTYPDFNFELMASLGDVQHVQHVPPPVQPASRQARPGASDQDDLDDENTVPINPHYGGGVYGPGRTLGSGL